MQGSLLDVDVIDGQDAERRSCEQALRAAGRPLPLTHRLVWEELRDGSESHFLRVRDEAECVFGCAAHISHSRALPGRKILRVPRFGVSSNREALVAAVRALAAMARSDGRVLRAHIEMFSRDEEVRDALVEACAAEGFVQAERPRRYVETVVVDLEPELDGIFASLHSTGRRHIRAVKKNPVEIRLVDSDVYAERLEELLRETLGRIGAGPMTRDWSRLISFCGRHPEDARLVGLFHTERDGPHSLLAYALGYNHGDHVEYSTAASTRERELKMPLTYGLAWDLIEWAKGIGADWFDFGGITRGTHSDPDDPRGGISDFKRYFTRDVVWVGEEWVLEPDPVRARFAHTITTVSSWIQMLSPWSSK